MHYFISLIAEEFGINVEGMQHMQNQGWDFFWKKLVHNSNKRGVEGGKKI